MAQSAESPYPGSRPFRQADEKRFFGRAADAQHLTDLWLTNNIIIGHGPAGIGKTSLLRAGALAQLEGERRNVLPVGRLSFGAAYPLAALPEHNPYTLALLRSWSPGETPSRLARLSVANFLRRRAEQHSGVVYAAIDQAEELISDAGPRRLYRRRFLDELAEAVRDGHLHLLLMVREDVVGDFASALDGARYQVTGLSPENAVEAVTGPVDATDRSFAPGAGEELVAGLLSSHTVAANGREQFITLDWVDPALLQVVCADLWRSLPAERSVIRARDIRQYGDADTVLAGHCARVIAAVADDHDLLPARLRSWLVHTFITELGTCGTAYEGITDTAGMPTPVARLCEDMHLLRAEQRSCSRWYELLSARLIEPLRHAGEQPAPPVEPAEYLSRAGRAFALGELDLAERYAREVLRDPSGTELGLRAEASSVLGNVAYERGKPAEAEPRYREAARLSEAQRDTAGVASQLAAVGLTLLAQGQVAEAVNELRSAADRMPNDLLVQTELAWALWQLGEARGAVAVLNGVLAVDGGYLAALRARGEILADLGETQGARRDLDRVAGEGWPSARAARALVRAELGEESVADGEMAHALGDAPSNGPVLLYAARAETLGGDLSKAAELAQRALTATDPALPPHQRAAAQRLISARQASDR